MNILTAMWQHRNEPTLIIFGCVMLIVAIASTVLAGYQVFGRDEALLCDGQWLPKSGACEPPGASPQDSMPIGSIVPFFGKTDQIPNGWHECDGSTISNPSKNLGDADPNVEGIQVPDLRRKFIRGSENPIGNKGVTGGGKEAVPIEHAHEWARVEGHRWFSYNKAGQKFRVDDWGDGLGAEGTGEFPLKSHDNRATTSFYTNQKPIDVETREPIIVNTLPPYVDILYIIKVQDN